MSFYAWFTAGIVSVFFGMLALWALQQKTRNAGLVDLGWTLSIAFLSSVCLSQAPGWGPRRYLGCAMPILWGIRLGGHLVRRFSTERSEDPRYRKMRDERGETASIFFFLFFMLQAFLAAVLSTPFYVLSLNPAPGFHPLEIFAFALWAAAFLGEAIADNQMRAFRRNPANRGKVCDAGLWRYSRHPNYFFECAMWVSYFLFALPSPGGLWAAVSPALMIFFLVKVSGVPPSEEQSLKSRGDAYREYQKRTSVLVPWFPKAAR